MGGCQLMSKWYLVYCKARQEDLAASGLRDQGYSVYLPKVRVRKRRPGGRVDVEEPLFPRYLFVATSAEEQSIAPVQYTAGVQKLVKFGHLYMSVSDQIVTSIKQREDPDIGVHRFELPKVRKGDPVRIRSGVLSGIDAVFEKKSGKDRVVVLLELLGQQTRAEVAIEELET